VPDDELQSTVLNALTSLSIGSEQRKARIESQHITPLLLKLMHNPATAAESLSLIQSLVYCNDGESTLFRVAGCGGAITGCLCEHVSSVRKGDLLTCLLHHNCTLPTLQTASEEFWTLAWFRPSPWFW
jgi:hypothetical protein